MDKDKAEALRDEIKSDLISDTAIYAIRIAIGVV